VCAKKTGGAGNQNQFLFIHWKLLKV